MMNTATIGVAIHTAHLNTRCPRSLLGSHLLSDVHMTAKISGDIRRGALQSVLPATVGFDD